MFRCKAGAKITFEFNGTGAAITGNAAAFTIILTVDSETKEENLVLPKTSHRESVYQLRGLEKGKHTVIIEVVGGTLSLDGLD